jgi:chromosomal replication initiation ATPase DnaA
MNEDRRSTRTDWIIRSMLSILDLAYPYETLNDKAKSTKSFLRKRIMDYIHQIEYENSRTKEE